MPIVPKYENNVPGVVESGRGFGAPADNVRPSFDYESVMNRALQPWSQLADSTIKIEAYHRDTVVKARADEQLDAYNKEVQTTLYDPDKGLFCTARQERRDRLGSGANRPSVYLRQAPKPD